LFQVLRNYNTVIEDIVDETTASGTLDTIGELTRSLKQHQRIIHFSISGGRRLMTFLSFSAALLYFDTPDELLHLYTPEPVKDEVAKNGMMHLPPGVGQRLIEVPFAEDPVLDEVVSYINTLLIQDVLTESTWQKRLTKEDYRGLTPLFYSHVEPYGMLQLDMSRRLALA
jgi:hypothetical protein